MKGGSVYAVSQRDRVFCFQELDQIGAVPAVQLERAREWANREPATPAPYMAQDQKVIGILTGAVPESKPQPSRTSPALSGP